MADLWVVQTVVRLVDPMADLLVGRRADQLVEHWVDWRAVPWVAHLVDS